MCVCVSCGRGGRPTISAIARIYKKWQSARNRSALQETILPREEVGSTSITAVSSWPLTQQPDIGGRICSEITLSSGSVVCCLPCPSYEWFYPDSFKMGMRVSTYLNLAGVVCCCFLLLSFAVLPVEYTHRHYLSVCLTFSILLMQVGWQSCTGGFFYIELWLIRVC